MRSLATVARAALLAAGAATTTTARIFGSDNISRYLQQQKRDYSRGAETSIARRNRHTGLAHEHTRERARRARQAARVTA